MVHKLTRWLQKKSSTHTQLIPPYMDAATQRYGDILMLL